MRKPWIPKLVIDLGDGERYEVKSLMATDLELLGKWAGEDVSTRAQLVGHILAEDPTAWRALVALMRKKSGLGGDFQTTDVDLDAAEAWCVADDGREVDFDVKPQPCGYHRASLEGVLRDCQDCGQLGPEEDEDGNTLWRYVDDREPVPTRRARSSSTAPSESVLS